MTKTPEKTLDSSPVESFKDPEIDGWRLLVGRTLAGAAILTTLASAGATYEANRPAKVEVQPTIITAELTDSHRLDVGAGVGIFDTIPGQAEFKLPGIEATFRIVKPEITTVESISPQTDVQLMEWARKFDVDPKAVEPRGQEAIQSAAEQVKRLQAEGWTIEQITVQGFASDEADSRQGDNPGFGIDDEKNVKLANKRAGAVDGYFVQQLEQALGADGAKAIEDKITILDGEEVRDDALAQNIEKIANHLGMSTDDLVMEYNRHPKNVPAEAREVLEGLRQDRFVRIEIKALRNEVIQDGKDERIAFVLIPIIIPFIRRRGKDGGYRTDIIVPTPPARFPNIRFDQVPLHPLPFPPRKVPPVVPPLPPKPPIRPPVFEHAPKKIGKTEDPHYIDHARSRKQPRPFNNSQRGTRHMGQQGNRVTRSHGGNAH